LALAPISLVQFTTGVRGAWNKHPVLPLTALQEHDRTPTLAVSMAGRPQMGGDSPAEALVPPFVRYAGSRFPVRAHT